MKSRDRIQDLLSKIFNQQDAKIIYDHLESLINNYKSTSTTSSYHLDERQAALITYADQFQSKTENTLSAHRKFIEKWLTPEINTIHFLPFYPASSDGGFSVIDYNKIDPSFGDWSDLKNYGQALMFDSVFNHISASSQWFTQWLEGNDDYQDYFIVFSEKEYNDSKLQQQIAQVTRPRVTPLLTPFTRRDGTTYYVWTTFSADQIDLNLKNPKVINALLDSTFLYFKMGAKLLRIDAIPFYWKELGSNCVHLEKTHLFVKLLRAITDELDQGHLIITESNVPHQENISYWGNDDEAHMVYNFTLPPLLLHAYQAEAATHLHQWSQTISTTKESTFFNITATHDGIGVRPVEGILTPDQVDQLAQLTKSRGGKIGYRSLPDGSQRPYELNITWSSALFDDNLSEDDNIQKLVSSQLIMASFPGLPAFYIHSLLSSYNATELLETTGVNRSINRQKFNKEKIESELTPNSIRLKVLNRIKNALFIREQQPAFHPLAAKEDLHLHPQVWSFYRIDKHGERVLVLLNISSQTTLLKETKIVGKELLSNEELTGQLSLAPYQISWIKCA